MHGNESASAYAPAVVKLFGEHAVVYGELSVGAAVDMYAYSHIEKSAAAGPASNFYLYLEDLKIGSQISIAALKELYRQFQLQGFAEFSKKAEGYAFPYLFIASRLVEEHGIDLSGAKATIRSNIPIGKGLASSAACSTAFTVSLLNYSSLRLDDRSIIEIARDGERIAHRNQNAGAIDVSTTYHGGYVSFSKDSGAHQHEMHSNPSLLIIDTGPKKSTAETVGHVSEMYSKEKAKAELIIKEIGKCSHEGLQALKNEDYALAGRYMIEDHKLLDELGVSTPALNAAVQLAVENGAFGAKLSGGGGGGIMIALAPSDKIPSIEEAFKSLGMKTYAKRIAFEGAKSSIGNADNARMNRDKMPI